MLMTRLEIIELINKHIGYVDTHTKNNIIALIEKLQKDNCINELQKCKDDPYYFFTEYCTVNGERPSISEERFREIWDQYQNSPSSVHLIKRRNVWK
jgi:hypothetical protein